MPYQIEFASSTEQEKVRSIFLASDMDLASTIEDHVVIKTDETVYGGGLLFQTDTNQFHLLTIAVRNDDRSRGVGSKLLQAILQHPWDYCRDAVGESSAGYRVTTVSRGGSRHFYLKNGFVDCSFEELAEPFDRQCRLCPDVAGCHSAAMVFQG